MSMFSIFDPTRPPPIIFPPLPSPFQHANNDQCIVQAFLSTKAEISDSVKSKQATRAQSIRELRAELSDLIEDVQRLQSNKEALEKEIESMPDSEWNSKLEQLDNLECSIESKLTSLNDFDRLELVRKKIHARRKKRAWLKRRNSRLVQAKAEALRNREELHAQIDLWQKEQWKQVEKEKQAQREMEFAAHFLMDVHRRKAACKRYLAKFEKMKGRINLDKDVQKEIEELTRTWTVKLAECIKEEKRMKDVLARKSAANYQRRVENEWNKALFGDAIPKKFDHPLLGADKNREVLIGIRRDWDACLVDQNDDEGSAIPLGWILPPENPTPDWAKYQIMETV